MFAWFMFYVVATYEAVTSAPAYKVPNERVPKRVRDSDTVLLEFCCSPDSELCKTAEDHGIKYLRLNQSFADLTDPASIEQIIYWIPEQKRVHLHGSLPCTVWSSWQHMSVAKYGEACSKRLKKRRED